MNAVLDSMIVQMKQTFSRNMYRFCLFVQPFISTVILGEMYKNSARSNFVAYVMLGAGLMSLWSCICFSSAGDINRERYSNTLSLIFVSPTSFRLILLGKIVGNTLLSLVSFVLTIAYAFVLYRVSFSVSNVGWFAIAFVATIICFIVVSTLIAYLLTLSRKTQVYMNCLDIPLTLICGFAFPVEHLPKWGQYISNVLPPTWAVKLLRQSVLGDFVSFWRNMLILLALIAVCALLSAVLYKTIERQVKIKATLEVS